MGVTEEQLFKAGSVIITLEQRFIYYLGNKTL